MLRKTRLVLVALAVAVTLPAVQTRAGTITVTYAVSGGSLDVSAPHVSPTGGSATIVLSAFRATPSATTGIITGGSVTSLFLSGPDPGAGTSQIWTFVSGFPFFGGGSFFGLTPAGGGFSPGGGFGFGVSLSGVAGGTHGFYGPFFFSGTGMIAAGGGSLPGSGFGSGCFNFIGAYGPCTAWTPGAPPVSAGTGAAGPGFNVAGAEIGRTVAMEPVPEPTTAALLALGLLGVAGVTRKLRRN